MKLWTVKRNLFNGQLHVIWGASRVYSDGVAFKTHFSLSFLAYLLFYSLEGSRR